MHFWFPFVVLSFAVFSTALRQQAVAIKGKLLCGSAAARNVRVKLWDEDSGNFSFFNFYLVHNLIIFLLHLKKK